MANTKRTYQSIKNISIPRKEFKSKVVYCDELSKKDYKVLMHLLTYLDGEIYKEISKKQIGDDLYMTKSDVSKSIENLIQYDIIEEGSSSSVKNGLKLLF